MTDDKNNPGSEQRGVDGLTEVLRLQAEALSRISERMAGSQGFPGALPPAEPHRPIEPPRDPGHLPVLAVDPALNEESLPVLNSFKKFLDQERQRARKRMLWVLLGFTLVFSGVLAVIVWMNSERARSLKDDIGRTQAQAERSRQEASQELHRLSEKSTMLATQNVATMRRDLTRNILWAHSVISSNLSSELSDRDSTVERLKEKVSSLEIENAMLSRQMGELDLRLKTLEDNVKEGAEQAALEARIRQQESTATVTNKAQPAPGKTTPVLINSAKFGRSFQLRMPQE